MKILQVLNHFPPGQIAGTEVYTWALSKNLIKLGFDVNVVIPNFNFDEDEEYVYDGIKVFKFSERSQVDRKLIMGFRPPDGLRSFIQLLKKEKPDVVHFHELAGSNGITLNHVKSTKELGVKVVMTLHLAGYSCKTGSLVKFGDLLCDGIIDERICGACFLKERGIGKISTPVANISVLFKGFGIDFRKINSPIGTLMGTANIISQIREDLCDLIETCDKVVCLTQWYQEILIKNGYNRSKIVFIAQGLPTNFVSAKTITKRLKVNTPLKLIFLGRISHFKGIHLLIDALTQIPSMLVELSIYGGGQDFEYESMLRKKTAKMNNIQWMGQLNQEDVIKTMSKHDILCLCSTFSEMSPLVIQEARAARIPVLASNVYGNAEQIEDGVDGLLFEFNSIESLKCQIEKLIKHPELLIELKNNTRKHRNFEDVVDEYLDLYNDLLTK